MDRQSDLMKDAADQLWSRLQDGRTGMLWVKSSDDHPQLMTHFGDQDDKAIWFISSADTDLVQGIAGRPDAGYLFATDKGDYHVSLKGALEVCDDKGKLDELWSVAIAAWFERGRDDPKVRLLRFSPAEAAVWASESNAILVGWRMVKAAMNSDATKPDVGRHMIIDFRELV